MTESEFCTAHLSLAYTAAYQTSGRHDDEYKSAAHYALLKCARKARPDATPEAVEKSLLGRDAERGSMFHVERAKPVEFAAAAL